MRKEFTGVGLCLLGLFLTAAFATRSPSDPPMSREWRPGNGVENICGIVGAYVAGTLFEALGHSGGWAVCILVITAGVGLIVGVSRKQFFRFALGGMGCVFGAAMVEALLFDGVAPYGGAAGQFYSNLIRSYAGTLGTSLLVALIFFSSVAVVVGPPIRRFIALLNTIRNRFLTAQSAEEETAQEGQSPEPKAKKTEKTRRKKKVSSKKEEVKTASASTGNTNVDSEIGKQPEVTFVLPPLDVFALPPQKKASVKDDRAIKETANQLKKAFATYGVEIVVTGINKNPSFVTYRVKVPDKTRLKVVKGMTEDLALKMGVPGLSIDGPVDEPNTVIVSMPREERETVWMREVLTEENRNYFRRSHQLPLFLGKCLDNRPLIVDLHHQPHLLIGGTTGSGKTVCVSSIIASVVTTRTPEEARLILIDPKRVEFTRFKGIPHLLCEVIDDVAAASAAFEWAVYEMEYRYKILRQSGVNSIIQLNKLDEERREKINAALRESGDGILKGKLPYIIIVVDEFADLISQTPNPKQLQNTVIRLAQKARAAGIHLVLATQRPSTDVVQGLLKANFPSRIAFRVASPVDSRIILGGKGAEKLLGRGDMFYVASDGADIVRAQAVYLSNNEIDSLVRLLREQPSPGFDEVLQKHIRNAETQEDFVLMREMASRRAEFGINGEGEGVKEGLDPLFFDAVDTVMREGRASCGVLQSNMGIGYPRANKILKQMEERGIIGPVKMGAKSRDILVSPDDWRMMKERMRKEIGGDSS